MQATPQQVRLLQHTLGLSEHQRRSYRNHFVAGPGHHDMPDLDARQRHACHGPRAARKVCGHADG